MATPTYLALNSLPEDLLADLRARATAVAHHAHAPYSHFRVGAALLLAEPHAGQIITGCNVENSSFRLTCCAEQVAIGRAVAELGPTISLRAVAVANLNQAASMPCGACRQTLVEFAPDPNAVLVLFPGQDASGNVTDQVSSLASLLPAAFRFQPLR